MADIDIDVQPQQSPIEISPNPQQNIIPVEVGEGTAPTYWGQILGDIDNQTDLKEKLDAKQDVIEDLDKYLKNETTQDNALAIKGSVTGPAGTAIGDNANSRRAGVAIGRKAEAINYGVAIGGTDGENTITHAAAASVAIGYGAVCSGSNAAQIGMGENTTGGTFQFQDYRLLNANGTIPNDRIPQLADKANIDLDNLSATGEAKFDAKADVDLDNLSAAGNAKFMRTDASNANPRLATYAELQEVKNMMLGNFDWANIITNITINGNDSSAVDTYTCPKDGYLFITSAASNVNTESRGMRINSYPVWWNSASAIDKYRNLSNAYPVRKDDVVSVYGASNINVHFDFVPRIVEE